MQRLSCVQIQFQLAPKKKTFFNERFQAHTPDYSSSPLFSETKSQRVRRM